MDTLVAYYDDPKHSPSTKYLRLLTFYPFRDLVSLNNTLSCHNVTFTYPTLALLNTLFSKCLAIFFWIIWHKHAKHHPKRLHFLDKSKTRPGQRWWEITRVQCVYSSLTPTSRIHLSAVTYLLDIANVTCNLTSDRNNIRPTPQQVLTFNRPLACQHMHVGIKHLRLKLTSIRKQKKITVQ